MHTASAQPAAVLDYAAPRPQDPVLRWVRAVTTVLVCMLLCAGAGHLFQPTIFRASALVQIDQTVQTWTPQEQLLDVKAMQTRQAAAAAGLKSPANINAAVAALKAQGVTVTPAQLAANLKIDPIAESRLIQVRYDDPTPQTAAAVVNTVMSTYTANGVRPVINSGVPLNPQRSPLCPVAGAAVGLLLGVAIVALRWK